MSIMRVIALDPGITTGYAIGQITFEGKMLVVTGQEKWSHLELWGFFEDYTPDFLITERFEYRNRARAGLELFSRELIGVTNLWHQMHMDPAKPLVAQMPAVIGGYFTDKRLKTDNIFKEGRPHSNDAARHLLHWFQFGPGFQYNELGYESAA
jgi:hypothetical protein